MNPSAIPFDEHIVFRSLFEAYPDALLLVDAGGVIVLANPAASEMLGYELSELVGLSVDRLVPEAIRPRHAAYRSAYAKAPRARPMGTQMELVAKRRDGSEVMVEIALSPLQGQGLPYVVAAIRGIEAYPRVKQALLRARYSDQVAQFGRLAVDTRDQQRLIEEAPRTAATGLQVPHAAVYLLDADTLKFRLASGVGLLEEDRQRAHEANTADSLAGLVVTHGQRFVIADAEHPHTPSVSPWYFEAGLTNALAVPLSDRGRAIGALVARSKAEQRFGNDEVHFLQSLASLLATSLQRAQSDEALNHAQRLESVGQLTGGIAHDFNNLLTVISGNLQVAQDMPPIPDHPAIQQMIAAAARAAQRGANLTEKLLTFSRRQVLVSSTVDPATLLMSLADMLRRTLDQRIHIEVHVQPDCPPCLADRTQLESALLNIAINARDAMPDGGTLRFSARGHDSLPANVAVKARTGTPRYVAIAVADTGMGMTETVMERAFEPFFTTKEAGRGTGLGLSTVYGFATQSCGAVDLQSTLGRGTTITLYLPEPVEQRSLLEKNTATASVVPPGLRVLMVDDEPEVRCVAQTFLTSLGCEAVACATAEQALALLSQTSGPQPFDLLLTDVALGPGMRGTDLAIAARCRWPSMSILLMSGFSEDLLEHPSSRSLLRKPFSRADLAEAIAQAAP